MNNNIQNIIHKRLKTKRKDKRKSKRKKEKYIVVKDKEEGREIQK